MDKPSVVAIIQARLGSTRLPGKVLMPLAGKPVLWHIIHRLRQCRMVNTIAIATSDQPIDDALVAFAKEMGVPLVRGSEENVLKRYGLAAQVLDADYIVRVTGDSPLIDPETVDLLVQRLVAEDADYCVNTSLSQTIHEGFDPFSRRALDRLQVEAEDDPIAREHVTAYFKCHPNFGRVAAVTLPPGYEIDGVRASVDTPADLLFLETLYQRLGAAPGEINLLQVVQLLRQEPELKQINAHVRQKDATLQYGRMLIRCDGSPQLGLGHVVRCLALAAVLRDSYGVGVCFALGEEGVGAELVRQHNLSVEIRPVAMAETLWLDSLIQRYKPHALILDVRTDLAAVDLVRWRQSGLVVAVIDDSDTGRRNAAVLAFYPPVPQLTDADWTGFCGTAYIGWDYVLLRPEFAHPRLSLLVNDPPKLLVTMGGSDPAGLTLAALASLQQVTVPFQAQVVLGRAFLYDVELERLRPQLPPSIRFVRDVTDMSALMAQVDLALAAFGGTAFELAALNVPALLLCATADHVRSAQALAMAGMAEVFDFCSPEPAVLAASIQRLLADRPRRDAMAVAGQQLDGHGVERIARILVERSALLHG